MPSRSQHDAALVLAEQLALLEEVDTRDQRPDRHVGGSAIVARKRLRPMNVTPNLDPDVDALCCSFKRIRDPLNAAQWRASASSVPRMSHLHVLEADLVRI